MNKWVQENIVKPLIGGDKKEEDISTKPDPQPAFCGGNVHIAGNIGNRMVLAPLAPPVDGKKEKKK